MILNPGTHNFIQTPCKKSELWYNNIVVIATYNRIWKILMITREVITMYELKRIYTGVNEVYVQGKGWIKSNTESKGDVITMYALDYIDIDDNGVVHGTGIEDFSVERFRKLGFGVMELKNKVEKEKKTLNTAYRHELVKRVFFRYRNKKHGKAFKEYLNSRYRKELVYNEIIATYH